VGTTKAHATALDAIGHEVTEASIGDRRKVGWLAKAPSANRNEAHLPRCRWSHRILRLKPAIVERVIPAADQLVYVSDQVMNTLLSDISCCRHHRDRLSSASQKVRFLAAWRRVTQ